MKNLVTIYEEITKLNSDLRKYEFSTDFLYKKKSYFASDTKKYNEINEKKIFKQYAVIN